MIYSIHTFELSLILDSKKLKKQLSKAYEKAKKKHRLYEENNIYTDNALASKGIKIEYHNDVYKKKIKFIVNPSRVLGGDDLKLWKPNNENIKKLLRKLEEHMEYYFDSDYELDDFKLTRVDFTVNIDVGDGKNVSAYIKVLNNIGKVKGFAPKYGKYDERIDKSLSFDLEGNSNNIEFTAYDKEAESRRKEAKGLLRIEIRLMKQKAIKKYTNETATAKQIKDLSRNSKEIFLETFTHVVPRGNYYKMKRAVALVESSLFKKKQKEKMLHLLEFIPKKKSLLLAQKELNDRNIYCIMELFAELNVSPVTINKRLDMKYLKSLYNYLGA